MRRRITWRRSRRLSLALTCHRYRQEERFDDALRMSRRAIDIAHATNWPTQVGAALMIVSLIHRAQGDLDAALEAIRESVRMLEPAPDEHRTGRLIPFTIGSHPRGPDPRRG